jgi:hypothetical protein
MKLAACHPALRAAHGAATTLRCLPAQMYFRWSVRKCLHCAAAGSGTSNSRCLATMKLSGLNRWPTAGCDWNRTQHLGAHPLVLESCPEIRGESGTHADEGEETLQGMYAEGCSSIEESRIRRDTTESQATTIQRSISEF